MQQYKAQRFTGERAMYQTRDAEFVNCTFADGESPLKESRDIVAKECMFQWKYPFWYCRNVLIENCAMFEMSRAGIWYTENLTMRDTIVQCPKTFRRCKNLTIERVTLHNAAETLWNCQGVVLREVSAKGDYFAMNSSDMEIDGLYLDGNYSFDGCRNVVVRNSKLLSKDAFWNAENVTVYDSFISGEYLGWNSKNVTLINCTIESEQGFCYMEGVTLRNCRLLNTNLAFEYSTCDAEVTTTIDSVKNPISGRITATGIDEIIFDNEDMDAANTVITETGKQ